MEYAKTKQFIESYSMDKGGDIPVEIKDQMSKVAEQM